MSPPPALPAWPDQPTRFALLRQDRPGPGLRHPESLQPPASNLFSGSASRNPTAVIPAEANTRRSSRMLAPQLTPVPYQGCIESGCHAWCRAA